MNPPLSFETNESELFDDNFVDFLPVNECSLNKEELEKGLPKKKNMSKLARYETATFYAEEDDNGNIKYTPVEYKIHFEYNGKKYVRDSYTHKVYDSIDLLELITNKMVIGKWNKIEQKIDFLSVSPEPTK